MKKTPIRHTFEVRREGKPVNLSHDTVLRNWLRASVDFVNYQMEGWDRCRQLSFSLDYSQYIKEKIITRFLLERNGNCQLATYEAAIDGFKASVNIPNGGELVEVENTSEEQE